MMKSLPLLFLLLGAACTAQDQRPRLRPVEAVPVQQAPAEAPVQTPDRPMDEVPVQQRLANGDRQFGFANGCVIVLHPSRAVVKTEAESCELFHRDIALLYASAD